MVANANKKSKEKVKPRGREMAWEREIRTDFRVREGQDGLIKGHVEGLVEARKRKRLRQDTEPFQRGIIRHVALVLDLSEAMLEKDMRPNRYLVTLKYTQEYIREFFEQNPISQMLILAMYDGICIKISDLSGNPSTHISALIALRNPRNPREVAKEPKGSPSLQNALEHARASLHHTPSHGTREVIIILGALLSLDPGDIFKTISACVADHLRVAIIGMAGRLRICQEICAKTNANDPSSYTVALDQTHFRELLLATTTPPVIRKPTAAAQAANPASLLLMGFPSRVIEDSPTLCACHGQLTRGGYTCSRCMAKVCSLPSTCPSCHLTLILSTHLARSYHHLFPLRNWVEVSWQRALKKGSVQCTGCLTAFPPVPADMRDSKGKGKVTNGNHESNGVNGAVRQEKVEGASESSRYECETCGEHFCIDCDLFCHEVVHNCPGCQSSVPEGDVVQGQNGAAGDGNRMDVD
ncbi:TFIIH basal transcription factor complex, subunit SSL1 [Pseudovirgaria hyperparasitica]|uniref:General transcription and DNA repair factor IIH n=1 Tax=Pseudovirgaria hyperparasitica TaxID=470096 RepID=A0A6A6VXM7_9PEZI|nr:TFIIH basal transcription factor complex, subunit SSL1 [Pseudovirgaria hyperparasitica]KAF2755362.1 TFIIH basal transcription factor complex, subunit SSL1 [Pseudovirgaria hyperparasitica]